MIALIILLATAPALTLISPSPAASPAVSTLVERGESDMDVIGGFDIRSSSIDYNYADGDYTIPSRFTATNGGTDISADHAKGNSKQKVIVADGNVVIHQNRRIAKDASQKSHFTQGPSTLTCDHINADGRTRIYLVTGNVHFMQGTRDVTAERGTFNDALNEVHMEGHVIIKDQGQTLNANTVDYNTETGDGKAGGDVTVISPVATPAPAPPGETSAKHRGRR